MVPGVPRQTQAQQARAHRLRLRGVRAGVVVPVPAEDPPAVSAVHPQQRARRQHQQGGQTGGKVVHHIVHLRRSKADIPIGRLYVTQHGIHGIDRLIEEPQGRASDGQEHHGRHHAVGGILRHRLHRRPGDARPVQPGGIPAHDHAHRIARALGIPGGQGPVDLHALRPQGLRRQDLPAHDALHRQPKPGTDAPAQPQQKGRDPGGNRGDQHPQDPSRQTLPLRSRRENAAQQLLQRGDQLSDGNHRVGKAVGVSQQEVYPETGEQSIQRPHHTAPSRRWRVKRYTGFWAVIR